MAYLLAMGGGFSIAGRAQLQNTNSKPIGELVREVGSPPFQDFTGVKPPWHSSVFHLKNLQCVQDASAVLEGIPLN